MNKFIEDNYESTILSIFRDDLNYEYRYGPELIRDYRDVILRDDFQDSLERLNPNLPDDAIRDAYNKVLNVDSGSLTQKNAAFHDFLQNGVTVRYFVNGQEHATIVNLIDYNDIDNNDFLIVNQYSVEEFALRRPDIVVFINGLPLSVIELKSPSREETDSSEAYRQIRNYLQDIPSLFIYNAFCVLSDLSMSKAGTITSSEDRFMEWKTEDGSYESTVHADFGTFFRGIFTKDRLLDILKNFICFSHEPFGSVKIMAAYHQYFAVKKAVASTLDAIGSDGRAGVFWHTQGSGKSLSMVFYTQLLMKVMDSPTIVVITDRNDLDNQLFAQFSYCQDFLRQTPEQAESRADLKTLLEYRQAHGILFSTMGKFEEDNDSLCDRKNVIVIADEAHRSQYGLSPHIDEKTGKISYGDAWKVRNTLPNATFIGFTGTPISSRDRSTQEVFGNYIDIYDMTQSVEDGATRPVYYESRVINLELDKDILKRIDDSYQWFEDSGADAISIEKSKTELSRMEALLGAERTIETLVADIVRHYEESREAFLTGKALIVAYSRAIAIKIYREILCLRPNWHEKVKVVMTSSNNDPEDWKQVIGSKSRKEELARDFKDNESPFKIAIVVDMWLTGFDVPSLATMYVYKPMRGHNLMQAIARVNRVFKNKEGGLVVDYVGIAQSLKQAMNDYTKRDQISYGEMDIKLTALPLFQEKLSICRSIFHYFDYTGFLSGSDRQRAELIRDGANFILDTDLQEDCDQFIKDAQAMRQALSLCASIATDEEKLEAAFFEAVRTVTVRLRMSDGTSGRGGKSLKDINREINELLTQTIKTHGILNLFTDRDLEFSLFDSVVLEEISQMKQSNLAIEMLRKLLNDEIRIYRRTNLVKSEQFSEIMSRTMNNYIRGHINNDAIIKELIELAEAIRHDREQGNALGLSSEEIAFYDAITKPAAIKDFYENTELIAITRELTDTLRKNRTIDWQKKESAQANMRSIIKRLLKRYDYPPEGMEDALNTVIKQCELWVEND